jgi:hypothetical protein
LRVNWLVEMIPDADDRHDADRDLEQQPHPHQEHDHELVVRLRMDQDVERIGETARQHRWQGHVLLARGETSSVTGLRARTSGTTFAIRSPRAPCAPMGVVDRRGRAARRRRVVF